MAVLIECITLVIPVHVLEERFPGGMKAFEGLAPPSAFWCDGSLVALRFPNRDIARRFILKLCQLGFRALEDKAWKDLAVVDQRTASAFAPCEWLTIGRNSDGAVFAFLKGQEDDPEKIRVPAEWEFEGSLSQTVTHVPLDKANERFEFLRSEGLSHIYRDRETGMEVPAGRVRSSSEVSHWRVRLRRPDREERDRPVVGEHPTERQAISDEIVTVDMAFVDQREKHPDLTDDELMEEPVKAVRLAPNRFRLEQNPMITEMAGFKDTVEGKFNKHDVFVVEKVVGDSGLQTIRTGVSRMFYFSDAGKAFTDSIMDAGGMWDILFWGIFVYNVPKEQVGEFEEAFKAACKEAALLEKEERRLPGDLYRQCPQGGRVPRKEQDA